MGVQRESENGPRKRKRLRCKSSYFYKTAGATLAISLIFLYAITQYLDAKEHDLRYKVDIVAQEKALEAIELKDL